MTPEAIELVQSSFAKIKPIAPQAGALFYSHLFELAPELRPLFKPDVTDQGQKLMDMLATAVGLLRQPQRLHDAVVQLGSRHAAYGVKPEHFQPVGAALILTLEQGLGADFTPKMKNAWVSLYQELASVMSTSLRDATEAQKAGTPPLRPPTQTQRAWWQRLLGSH